MSLLLKKLMKTPVVEARDLVKRYANIVAVSNISFLVYSQEAFGFLGPNGAGKSSTMNMITCYSPVTVGMLRVFGMDVREEPRKIKAMMGVVPQETNLDPDLTVYENLMVYAGYFNIPKSMASERAVELLEFIQLKDKKDEYIPNLSGGMKRRLLIARALINKPKLLILDEPTTGLDPQSRHLVWEKLELLKKNNVTMIITTHYMEEAQRLCDRIMVIDRGSKIAEGTPAGLIQSVVSEDVIELRDEPASGILEEIKTMGSYTEKWGNTTYIFSSNGKDLVNKLSSAGADFYLRKANLEDVYLKLTGRALREEN